MRPNRIINLSDIIILLLLTPVVLLITNIDLILKLINGSHKESYVYFNENLVTFVNKITTYVSDVIFTPNVGTFFLWAVVGFVSYTLVGVIFDSTKGLKDTLFVAVDYVHPKNFSQLSYWFNFIFHGLLSTAFVAVMIAWIIWIFTLFIPFSSVSLVLANSDNQELIQRAGHYGLSYIGIFTGLLGLLLMIRIVIIYKTPK